MPFEDLLAGIDVSAVGGLLVVEGVLVDALRAPAVGGEELGGLPLSLDDFGDPGDNLASLVRPDLLLDVGLAWRRTVVGVLAHSVGKREPSALALHVLQRGRAGDAVDRLLVGLDVENALVLSFVVEGAWTALHQF